MLTTTFITNYDIFMFLFMGCYKWYKSSIEGISQYSVNAGKAAK